MVCDVPWARMDVRQVPDVAPYVLIAHISCTDKTSFERRCTSTISCQVGRNGGYRSLDSEQRCWIADSGVELEKFR